MPQHEPDSRPTPQLKLGGKQVRLKLDGVELKVEEPTGTRTEAKPKPPMPDDPRPAGQRIVPPYAAGG